MVKYNAVSRQIAGVQVEVTGVSEDNGTSAFSLTHEGPQDEVVSSRDTHARRYLFRHTPNGTRVPQRYQVAQARDHQARRKPTRNRLPMRSYFSEKDLSAWENGDKWN